MPIPRLKFAVSCLFRRVSYVGHRSEQHCQFSNERLRLVFGRLWFQRGHWNYCNPIWPNVAVTTWRDYSEHARFASQVVIYLGREFQKWFRAFINSCCTQFHLESSLSAIPQLHDCVDF